MWQWLREHRPGWVGALSFVALALYGVIPLFQPASFSRTYAAYGGIFIFLSLLWGLLVDRRPPARHKWLGGAICLFGACVVMYARRS